MKAHRSAWGREGKEDRTSSVCMLKLFNGFSLKDSAPVPTALFPLPTTPLPSEITTPQHPQNVSGGAGMPRECTFHSSWSLTTKRCHFKTESRARLQKISRNISLAHLSLKAFTQQLNLPFRRKNTEFLGIVRIWSSQTNARKLYSSEIMNTHIINENKSVFNCSHPYCPGFGQDS